MKIFKPNASEGFNVNNVDPEVYPMSAIIYPKGEEKVLVDDMFAYAEMKTDNNMSIMAKNYDNMFSR